MLTHLTEAISSFITNLYATTGLAGIIIAMAIESCCIPLPSEIVMPLAGGMLAQLYAHQLSSLPGVSTALPVWLSLILVALAGATGCLIGSIVAYAIGYSGGRPLLLKYGRYVLISQHDADRADQFFQRHGSATAFFSRLLPVIRTYISLPAGIARMPFARFCLYTFLGSFPWSLGLAYVGYLLGKNISALGTIFHGLDVVVLVVLVVLVALYIWRHIRNDRIARAEHAAVEAEAAAMQQRQWPQDQQPSQSSPWMQPSQPLLHPEQQPQSTQFSSQPWMQPSQAPQSVKSTQAQQSPQSSPWAPIPNQSQPQQQWPPQNSDGNQNGRRQDRLN